MLKVCEYCKQQFNARRQSRRFCSYSCSNTANQPKIPKQCKCEICDLVFMHDGQHYRTRCDEHIGAHSDLTKQKIADSMTGHSVSKVARKRMSQKAKQRWSK